MPKFYWLIIGPLYDPHVYSVANNILVEKKTNPIIKKVLHSNKKPINSKISNLINAILLLVLHSMNSVDKL